MAASKNETTDTKNDSPKNWNTSDLRSEPTTFFMPTSLALSVALAVERLMKLMQAMSSMNAAMATKSLTDSILPPCCCPSTYLSNR